MTTTAVVAAHMEVLTKAKENLLITVQHNVKSVETALAAIEEIQKNREQQLSQKEVSAKKNISELQIVFEKKRDAELNDIQHEKDLLENEKKEMENVVQTFNSRIKLNIGGHTFTTSRSTLVSEKGSMLEAMFSGRHTITPDETDGSYFIDRDGRKHTPVWFFWFFQFFSVLFSSF